MTPPNKAELRLVKPLLAASFLIALLFPVSGQDDFFITLWPASTLADSGEVLNYNGERVEQSSALLLTLVLGLWSALSGLDPAGAARWLSTACALATFLILERASGASHQNAQLARWLLAVSAPFLYWAASGTEMPLMSLLLLLWVSQVRSLIGVERLTAKPILLLAALSFMVTMNRPEGALLMLAALAWPLLLNLSRRMPRGERWWLAALLAAGSLGLLMMLRTWYFRSAWPLPVDAKAGSLGDDFVNRVWDGLSYLVAWNGFGLAGLPLLVAVLAGGALLARRSLLGPQRQGTGNRDGAPEGDPGDPGLLLCALLAAAILGFTITSGGDWMEGGRFLAPAAPLFALMTAHALRSLPWPRARMAAFVALLLAGATSVSALALHPKTRALPLWWCGQLSNAQTHGQALASAAWSERSNKAQIRDLTVLDTLSSLVARAESRDLPQLTLASHQMGYVAYRLSRRHPGSLRFIDAAGLVERSLVDCQAIAPRITRNAGGLWRQGFDYDPLLKVGFLLENVTDCHGAGAIDILYELGIPDPELLDAYGLTVIYVQDGTFLRRPSFTFVAVRHELVTELGWEHLRVVEYSSERNRTHVSVNDSRLVAPDS